MIINDILIELRGIRVALEKLAEIEAINKVTIAASNKVTFLQESLNIEESSPDLEEDYEDPELKKQMEQAHNDKFFFEEDAVSIEQLSQR